MQDHENDTRDHVAKDSDHDDIYDALISALKGRRVSGGFPVMLIMVEMMIKSTKMMFAIMLMKMLIMMMLVMIMTLTRPSSY